MLLLAHARVQGSCGQQTVASAAMVASWAQLATAERISHHGHTGVGGSGCSVSGT